MSEVKPILLSLDLGLKDKGRRCGEAKSKEQETCVFIFEDFTWVGPRILKNEKPFNDTITT